jgi:hypothetical protein
VLSLVFVPAMFMLMDDIGALFRHFLKKTAGHARRERKRGGRSCRRARTIAAEHRAFSGGGVRRSAHRGLPMR